MQEHFSKKHWCCFCESLRPEETGFVNNGRVKICLPCITECNAIISTGMRDIGERKIAELEQGGDAA